MTSLDSIANWEDNEPDYGEVYGTAIVAISTIISMIGVAFNNVALDHIAAMQVWMISNVMFAVFFYGQYKKWWNGGLPSAILCGFYVFCFITGLYGLVQP
jgi:hypothetical protein